MSDNYIEDLNQLYNNNIVNEGLKDIAKGIGQGTLTSLGSLGMMSGLAVGGDALSKMDTSKEPKPIVQYEPTTKKYSPKKVEFKNISSEVQEKEIDLDSLRRYIAKNEGIRSKKYIDSNGHPTIGIGHLITKNDKVLFPKLFGKDVDVEGIIKGDVELTSNQIAKLFNYDIQSKINTAKRLIPDILKYPQYVKNAIIDSFYRGDMGKKTRSLINKGEWEEASKEYLNHKGYDKSVASNKAGKPHGVARRMERNSLAFSAYAQELKGDE